MPSHLTARVLAVLACALFLFSQSIARAQGNTLTVNGFTLVASKRVSLTRFQYTYNVSVANADTFAALLVSASVTSLVPSTTQVVAGSLAFPDIQPGGVATSTNQLVIIQDRTVPFDRSQLQFAFQSQQAPFQLSVQGAASTPIQPPGMLSLLLGLRTTLSVAATRSPNFTGDVQLTISNLPTGLTESGSLSLAYSADLASPQLFADPRLLSIPSGTAQLSFNIVIAATGGGYQQQFPLTVNVLPLVSSTAKIAAALKAGTIDLGTALLYRAYATVNDAQLPDAYVGAQFEDNTLGLDVDLNRSSLSPTTLSLLQPYLVRPNDAQSIWSQSATPVVTVTAATAAPLARPAAAPVPSVRYLESTTCPTPRYTQPTWIYQHVNPPGGGQFVIWGQCQPTAPPAGVPDNAELELAAAGNVLNLLLPGMTAIMGTPLADLGSGGADIDSAIDIYILPSAEYIQRGLQMPSTIGQNAAAATFSVKIPGAAPKTSAYLMLRNEDLLAGNTAQFRSIMVHELFHMLQNAHNACGMYEIENFGVDLGTGNNIVFARYHWFVEASAGWAEVWFGINNQLLNSKATYDQRFPLAQTRTTPLNYSPLRLGSGSQIDLSPYAAFVWPLYVASRLGAGKIGALWTALEQVGARSWSDQAPNVIDDVLDSVMPFKDYYPEFAFTNFNDSFLPGDPLPQAERYLGIDPTHFDQDRYAPELAHQFLRTIDISAAPTSDTQAVDLGELSTAYYEIRPDYQTTSGRIDVDWSSLTPTDYLNVQAIDTAQVNGEYERRQLKNKTHETFCFPAGIFPVIHLAVSNSDHAQNAHIQGTLRVEYGGTPDELAACGCPKSAAPTGGYCFTRLLGGLSQFLYGINNSAGVIGAAIAPGEDGPHPAVWLNAPSNIDLIDGSSDPRRGIAWSINDSNQAVGTISINLSPTADVVLWPSLSPVTGPLTVDQISASSSPTTVARAWINSAGEIAYVKASGQIVRRDANGGVHVLLGSAADIWGLNTFDHFVTGDGQLGPNGTENYTLWIEDQPSTAVPLNFVFGLNDLDWVVGFVNPSAPNPPAAVLPAVWKPREGVTILPAPPPPPPQSGFFFDSGGTIPPYTLQYYSGTANGINNRGQIVGRVSWTVVDGRGTLLGCQHAVLWQPDGTVIDLNTKISSNSQFVLQEATAINDEGAIAVQGVFTGDSEQCGPGSNSSGGPDSALLSPVRP